LLAEAQRVALRCVAQGRFSEPNRDLELLTGWLLAHSIWTYGSVAVWRGMVAFILASDRQKQGGPPSTTSRDFPEWAAGAREIVDTFEGRDNQ
jgi:hypothetical protein